MDRLIISGIDGPDGLKALAADLDRAARVAPESARSVVQKGALNVKTDAQKRVSGIAHAPLYPATITYDSWKTEAGAGAEIGPDPEKRVGGGPHRTPGNLGAIFEYGSVNNAPIPHLAPALEAERPRFERAMQDLAVDALEQRR